MQRHCHRLIYSIKYVCQSTMTADLTETDRPANEATNQNESLSEAKKQNESPNEATKQNQSLDEATKPV